MQLVPLTIRQFLQEGDLTLREHLRRLYFFIKLLSQQVHVVKHPFNFQLIFFKLGFLLLREQLLLCLEDIKFRLYSIYLA